MKKVITYTLKILGWIFLGVVTLLILAALLIQTPFAKRKIASIAENQAGSFIHGQLSLGEIDGNFFTHLSLKDLLITQETDTLAYIKEISTSYNLLPLIDGKLQILNLKLLEPRVFLEQLNDSTWNVQQLIKTSDSEPTTDTTSSDFAVNLDRFQLENGSIQIDSPDTLIPREINRIELQLSGAYQTDKQELNLNEFSFTTREPNISLEKLTFSLRRNKEAMTLNDFVLKTAKNQFQGEADYAETPSRKGNANFESAPIKLSEFEFVLPDFQFPATPVFTLQASLRHDSVRALVEIEDKNQRISIDLVSENLYDFILNPEKAELKYSVNGQLENINLAYLLNNPELKSIINGKLTAKGEGTDPATAKVKVKGNFQGLKVQDYSVDQISMNFDLERGNLSGFAKGKGDFGEFEIQPNIQQLETDPRYQIELITKNLDIAAITGNDSLQSDINLKANVNGHGFDPEKLSLTAKLQLKNSSFQKIQLDTLLAAIQYRKENIEFDSLLLHTKSLVASVQGNYAMKGRSDIDLKVQFTGLEEFKDFIPIDSIETSGKLHANISGTMDSLSLDASLNLAQTTYADYSLESIQLDAEASIFGADTNVMARLKARDLRSSIIDLDSIVMDVNGNMDSIYVDGRLRNADLSASLKAGIVPEDILRITLADLLFDYKNQHWELQSSPAIIEIAPESYTVSNFNFATNASDSAQSIKAEGIIRLVGTEDFTLEVSKIDLEKLVELSGEEIDLTGIFDLKMNLSGEASNPKMVGEFAINKAIVNDYKFIQFDGTFDLENNYLKADAHVIPQDSGRFEITATVPFELQLDSMNVAFSTKDTLNALVTIEQFPLAILQTLDITENIKGYAEGKIEIGGSIEAPKPKGNFRLVNAAVSVPEYGINYEKIAFNLTFNSDKVVIDTFNIKSADGTMKAIGEINFNADFYNGDISDSKINITFNKFNPVNNKQFNMQLSGDASLQGKAGDVVFVSNLRIPKSEFNLPAIMRLMGNLTTTEMPTPLLLREMKKNQQAKDSTLTQETTQKAVVSSATPDYFDSLKGKAKISIPRNTWIKSEDMRIELSGDLELIKESDFFEVFGTVDVVRGQYDLMGKTFIIEKGNITFQGGEDMMPLMDIAASYTFRNAAREQQKLVANVSGDAEQPEISFTLDGNSINEGDAISYILFGKSLDELSLAQQDNMQSNGSIAGNAAASLLSAQLTKFLGNKLNVDYIEINSTGGNFDNASMQVGKYITNDLFISYEQRIGQSNEDDFSDYEVKLEYEVFRFLFLQLNNSDRDSGFDVIIKVEAE